MKINILPSIAYITLLPSVVLAETDHHNDHHHHIEYGGYGHIDSRTYTTNIYEAEDNDEEIIDIFTHSHIEGGYRFHTGISLNGSILLEGDPAGHSHNGTGTLQTGHRLFDEHPLFIESLTINYDTDSYGGYIGKFSPLIGIDIHSVPGWWGPLVFEEFEIKERLGIGGYVSGTVAPLGTQRLDISSFTADTTFLQESILYNRPSLKRNDGGVSNTGDLTSFSSRLSGDLGNAMIYAIGFAHQANDTGNDENRFTIELQGKHHYKSVGISPLISITSIHHLDGEPDHNRIYSTAGIGLEYQSWTSGMTYTSIDNQSLDRTEGMDGYNFQTSIGYNFQNGFGTDVGYQSQSEEGESSNRIGALLRYHAEF